MMSMQKKESVVSVRARLQSRRTALLATFSALMLISEIIQGQFLETLNIGFGIELPDVFGLIGLTFTAGMQRHSSRLPMPSLTRALRS